MKLPPDLKGCGESRSPRQPLRGALSAARLLVGSVIMAVVVYAAMVLLLAL